jgi:hypothetical protein
MFFLPLVGPLVRLLVGPLVRPLVDPHITSKTSYVAIASRRGEGRGYQLMSKTGYVEIALRLVTVARSCLFTNLNQMPYQSGRPSTVKSDTKSS